MSSNINLDLDFQDYAPREAEETVGQPGSGRQKPEVVIKIPDNRTGPASGATKQTQSSSSDTIGNTLQNVTTNFPTAGLTDETLRQFIRVSAKQRQQTQSANSGGNWGLNYFAQFFDVTTSDVLQRILWSAVPIRKTGIDLDNLGESDLMAPLTTNTNEDDPMSFVSGMDSDKLQSLKGRPYSYMERFIQSRPDMYGPFWVSTTLIFTVAIFSNIISFSRFKAMEMNKISLVAVTNVINTNQSAEMASNELLNNMDGWHYSMEELNMATSVVMMYVLLLPTFLWFLFWFRGCTKFYTLAETICAYGYIVLGLAVCLSGLVLLLSFVPIVRSDPNPTGSRVALALVPGCHLGFAYIIHRIMLQ